MSKSDIILVVILTGTLLLLIIFLLFRKHIIGLYENHPKFRTCLNTIDDVCNSFLSVYWIIVLLIVAGGTAKLFSGLFSTLPIDYQAPVITIASTLTTSLLLPFILNNIKAKKERKEKAFEQNSPFYVELASKAIDVIQERNQESQRIKIYTLAEYITEQHPYACINLSARQIDLLFSIKQECTFFDRNNNAKASIDNITNYTEKFLSVARKQGKVRGRLYLNSILLEKLEMPKDLKKLKEQSDSEK